jgi:Tol biopolymer transport system component
VKTFLTIAILALAVSSSAAGSSHASTERVSVSSAGAQGDRDSFAVGLSSNARFVLINSLATNLVPGDTNNRWDVFVYDRSTGAMQRVSVTSRGAQAKPAPDPWGGSLAGGISASGRYVAYSSDAPNLVPHDTNSSSDVFVYDRTRHRVTRVSVSSRGRQANGPSGGPAISANGRYVAFSSTATNLVAGDTNGLSDVFVRDLRTGRTIRVSVTSRGRQARCNAGSCENTEPALSANGRYVAFESSATNLVRGDTNRLGDIFVRDLRTGRTQRVSVSSSGRQAGGDPTNTGSNAPEISANGRLVVFHSAASNLVAGDTNRATDIFVHDRRTGRTQRVSVSTDGQQADQESLGADAISPDGRYVAFTSLATNLVAGDANDITDVFIRDLRTNTTTLASLGAAGNQGDDASSAGGVVFSANDRYLAFSSWAANFVPGDTNDKPDAFLRDLRAG